MLALVSRWVHSSALRHEQFRRFYLGSVSTAFGYTMQTTVAAWLMTTLTPSALMVALVQTASTLPALLFGLAAGTLADIVDRRRVVVLTQLLLLAATLVLAAATLAGAIGPPALLMLTFLVGVGFTFYMPAQQALVNDLVPRTDLAPAVALAAVAFNVARAVAPALAGALAAWLGSGSAMLASALFFVWMIFALRGVRAATPSIAPGIPETLLSGIQSGVRYVRHSPPLRALVIRNLAFSFCASALWALLPVVARDQLALGAGGYGMLVACFGAGAVVGALWIPRHLERMPLNSVVTGGYLLWIAAAALVAGVPLVAAAIAGACAAGAAWVSVLATLSAGTQSSAPAWVRARAVSTNLVANQASLAVGSVVWGTLASAAGTRIALALSAGVMLLLLGLTRRIRVGLGDEADVTGVQLPEFALPAEPMPDDGPVLIQLEYRIDPHERDAFLRAIYAIEPTRRRNGASYWRVYHDLEDEGRFVERFVITSWAEYVRLRARTTVSERRLQVRVRQLHRGDAPIRVSRLIGVSPRELEAAWEAGTAEPAGPE